MEKIIGKLAISEIVLFDKLSNKRRATGGVADVFSIRAQECGQTLARVRVSWTYISIIIISLQQMEST